MLRIVWGTFLIFSGGGSISYAWFSRSVLVALQQASLQFGLPSTVQPRDMREIWFFLVLGLLCFLVGSFLIYTGDEERQERIFREFRNLVFDVKADRNEKQLRF